MATITKKHLYEKIADELREKIGDHYYAGDFVESERVLAKHFSVNQRTVSQAMDILSSEGRIVRARGKGTVVSDPLATGGFVIYLSAPLLTAEGSSFYRITCSELSKILHEFNPRWQTRMYLKPSEPQRPNPIVTPFVDGMHDMRIRGVFSFHRVKNLPSELKDSTMPIVGIDHVADGHGVFYDETALFHEALKHFREVGCRKVGLIWMCREDREKEGIFPDQTFCEEARANGIETRQQWMPACKNRIVEQEGYDLFRKLWEQKDRPDGILVADDVLCRGVLTAIQHANVNIPKELSLISQANKGSPLTYHKKVTTVELDTAEIAREALDMMVALVRGEELDKKIVLVRPKLCVGDTVCKIDRRMSNV